MSQGPVFSQHDADLSGVGVLVTRPAHQAETLCQLIEAVGGIPIRFPTLEIQSIGHSEVLMKRLAQLADYDMVIFVSPNAVTQGLPLIRAAGGFPADIVIAAVGGGTQRELRKAGLTVGILPAERFDSEGLLACEELSDVSDKNILIVRGQGGRPLLGDTLSERGAQVDYAAVYVRALPELDAQSLIDGWHTEVDIVITTSNEVLNNLVDIIGETGLELLRQTPLVLISERMVDRAEELLCTDILQAPGADDNALLATLIDWTKQRRKTEDRAT